MKKLILSTILLGSFITFQSFAGERAGNGGDVIVCPDSVILLDAYEMDQRGMTLDLPGSSPREIISNIIKNVQRVDPHRAGRLSFYSNELLVDLEKGVRDNKLLKNILFTTDKLPEINDSYEFSIPKDCKLEQLVVQRNRIVPEDKRYAIAVHYWERMDDIQKTLTILHESWYQTHLETGAVDSRFSRYMNELFASKEYREMNFLEYLERQEFSKELGSFPDGIHYPIVFKNQFYYFNSYKLVDSSVIFEIPEKEFHRIKLCESCPNIKMRKVILNTKGEIQTLLGKAYESGTLHIKDLEIDYYSSSDSWEIALNGKGEVIQLEGYARTIKKSGKILKKGNFINPFIFFRVSIKDNRAHLEFPY